MVLKCIQDTPYENLLLLNQNLESKVYKYMAVVSKNVLIYKLDEIVDRYKNNYYKSIKMQSVYVKLSMVVEHNKNDSKLKVSDLVKTSKQIFARD